MRYLTLLKSRYFSYFLLIVSSGYLYSQFTVSELDSVTGITTQPTPTEAAPASRTITEMDQNIAKIVARLIQDYHYEAKKLNDALSETVYEEYFLKLDPNRYFFLESDIQDFKSEQYKLDDALTAGNVDFAFTVFARFLQRVKERVDYIKNHINDQFDLDGDEEMVIDRSDMPWAKDTAELDDLWRKRLMNQFLIDEFIAEKEEKEKHEKSMKEGEVSDISQPKEPLTQRIIKQYENYYHTIFEADDVEVIEHYLTALLKVYDPHSSYLNWRSLEDFDISMKLSLQGIGATLKSVGGYTEIVDLITGGPADKDGRLQPGDRIIAVAQKNEAPVNVVDMPLNKVVRYIRGPKGTEVSLQIIRSNGNPFLIRLIRDEVQLKDQEAQGKVVIRELPEMTKLNLGVIDIPSFYADFEGLKAGIKDAKSTSSDVRKIIDGMYKNDHIQGLIIDLRSNGGGSLEEAINLTGLFIPEGPVVQVRSRKGVDVRNDNDNGFYFNIPLLIMVNRSSASASEIFSGAIKDYGRGVVVGDQMTHGKGTVQTVLKLDRFNVFRDQKPGAMKYTMAKFYRVTGASTQNKGITPDIIFGSFLDYMDIGESNLDHVMPWDEIAPAEIVKPMDISGLIPELKARSQKRLQANNEYQILMEDIQNYAERRQLKTIPLNREKRQKYREEDEYWSEKSKAVLGKSKTKKSKVPNGEETEPEDDHDLYLEEGLNILADLVTLANKSLIAGKANKSGEHN